MSDRRRMKMISEYAYSGETDGYIDLSKVDNEGNPRPIDPMVTANCYLVHSVGNYKIPLVYGNSIKNSNVNTDAFIPGGSATNNYCTNFLNHNNDEITGPWITKSGSGIDAGMGINVISAELLWQDVQSLISSVFIDGDYLKFTVGTFNGGNAMIAVKDNSGTIVWSWHIWATSNTLSNTTVVNTGAHIYTVSPVYLGWVPTGGGGKQGYCTYYQGGRKDPIIPAAGFNQLTNHTVYNISNSTVTGYTGDWNKDDVTIGDGIKNPNIVYTKSSYIYAERYNNLWCSHNVDDSNTAIATEKTIYDPCPPGFCVPTKDLFRYIYTNSSSFNWDSTNLGRLWTLDKPNIFFPMVGERGGSNGNLFTKSYSSKCRASVPLYSSLWIQSDSVANGGGVWSIAWNIIPVTEE